MESVTRGDDPGTLAGHVLVRTADGAVIGALAGLSAEAAGVLLAAAGVSGAAVVIVPAAAMIGTGVLAGRAIDEWNETLHIEQRIHDCLTDGLLTDRPE